jgi:hypothetical protein
LGQDSPHQEGGTFGLGVLHAGISGPTRRAGRDPRSEDHHDPPSLVKGGTTYAIPPHGLGRGRLDGCVHRHEYCLGADNSFQVVGDTAQLGPEGATVAVPVIANCSAGFFGTTRADVRQSTGKLLNTGFGFGENFVCTGTDQLFSVTVFASAFPYKQGKASVIAGMTATDPVTFQNFDTAVGPLEMRIRK